MLFLLFIIKRLMINLIFKIRSGAIINSSIAQMMVIAISTSHWLQIIIIFLFLNRQSISTVQKKTCLFHVVDNAPIWNICSYNLTWRAEDGSNRFIYSKFLSYRLIGFFKSHSALAWKCEVTFIRFILISSNMIYTLWLFLFFILG